MATKPHCFQSSFSGNHHHWKDRGIKHFQYILRVIWHISKTTFQPTCYFLALLLSQRSSTQFYHFEREFFGRLERTTRWIKNLWIWTSWTGHKPAANTKKKLCGKKEMFSSQIQVIRGTVSGLAMVTMHFFFWLREMDWRKKGNWYWRQ